VIDSIKIQRKVGTAAEHEKMDDHFLVK